MRTTIYALVATLAFSGFAACKKDDKTTDSPAPAKATDKPSTDKPAPAVDKPSTDKPTATVDKPATPPPTDKPATPPAAGGGDSVTLAYVAPAVGSKWVKVRKGVTDMDIDKMGKMHQDESAQETTEIIAGTADAVTKEKVTYDSETDTTTMGGKDQAKPSPLAGKSYVLTLDGGKLTITNGDGSPASDDDVKAVTKKEKDFVKGDQLGKYLGGKTFKKDEAVDLPSDTVTAFLDQDGLKSAKMTLTYKGMDGALAQFAVTASFSGEDPDQHLDIDATLSGTVEVDPATNQSGNVSMTGPMKLSGPITASGTTGMTETNTKAP